MDLDAETYALWISCTEQFLEDNLLTTIGNYFRDIIQEEWQQKFDTELLTSASSPTGLLTAVTSNIVTMNAGSVGFQDVTDEDLWSLVEELTTRAKRRNAHFIMHPTVLDYVRQIKNANGDYIIRQPTEAGPGRLFGFPIIQSDQMPDSTESAVSTSFVAFGDPKQLLFGDRVGLEIRYFGETVHAVSNTEVFFRARIRCAFAVAHEDSFAVLRTAAE